MIDALIKSLHNGITVIEESRSSAGRVFLEQIASNAASLGKKVTILSTRSKEEILSELELYSYNPSIEVKEADHPSEYRELEADLVVIDSFSSMVFDFPEKSIFEFMKELRAETRRGASFALYVDPDTLPRRASALLRCLSDNHVEIKTEFFGVRIVWYLYITKLQGRMPFTKLLKFTIDERGVQIDTRELVG